MTDIMVIGARGIPDVEGGAEKNAEAVFPILAEKGYAVEVVAMRQFTKSRNFKGVKLRSLPTLRLANTDKLVYHALALVYAVVMRPKLVHLQGLNSAFFLALYRFFGLKTVMRYGSADYEHAKWGFLGRAAFRLCEWQLRFADHLIVVSRKYKDDLGRRYGLKRVEVVPNGVDPASVSDEAERYWASLGLEKRRYVLAIGRLSVDKDYDTLIEAFSRLDDPTLDLVIVGGASETHYAERLFATKVPRVRFLGRIERRLLSALYENCAVFVKSSRHEGLSNAVLEAISYRCPLIVSDIAANTEMALGAVSYFPVGNAAILRERLEASLKDPDAFVANTDQFLDWPRVAMRTEAVYQKVIPGLGGRMTPADRSVRADQPAQEAI